MKKVLPFLLFIPLTSSAQSSNSGISPIEFSIALFITIVVFIVLREVVMWYWKVNIIVRNQESLLKSQQETNNLLSEQITLMRSQIELTIGKSEIGTD